MHAELLRTCQGEPTAGRMSGIINVVGFTAAVARRDAFYLERDDVRDGCRAPQPLQIELYRLVGDAPEVADQVRADEGRWAARPTAHNLSQQLALSIICSLVDDAGKDPVTIGHHFPRADQKREFEAVELDVPTAPLIDPEHERRSAVVVAD